MLREIFRFEAAYHLRSPVFWGSAIIFFLLAFGAVTTDVIVIGGAVGNVNRNSPFVIMQILLIMTMISAFVITAFVAGAVLRDAEYGTAEMLFSTPLPKRAYVFGRFLGALTVAAAILVVVVLAIMVGSAMPWLEPERVGPFQGWAYLYSFIVLVLPNLFLMSALFFALATITRSMMGTYVGLVAFFVGYAIAQVLLSDLDNRDLAMLLDPFGIGAFALTTQYWTTAERNTQVLGFGGPIILNRLVWIGVAVVVLALAYVRFSMTTEPKRAGRRWSRRRRPAAVAIEEEVPAPETSGLRTRPLPAPNSGRAAAATQFLRQSWFEIRGVVRSLPFLIILSIGVLNLIAIAAQVEQFAGTPVHPRTHLMLDVIQSGFLLFLVIIVTFYAGELVWRERQRNVDGIHDALPVPNWVYWGGKMAALAVVVLAVLGVGALATIGVQLFYGYTDLEPGLYAMGLGFMIGVPFLLIAVLALAAQVLTNNKWVGFLVMILYFISQAVFVALGWTHNLYMYAGSPGAPYSDMNGYGHFMAPTASFYAYWAAAALILLVLAHLFWVRGRETAFATRLRIARRRLRAGSAFVLVLATLAFLALGGWIFYNTNVLNDYVPPDEQRDRQAAYEKQYGQYEERPQPRITSVYAEVDIYPDRRAVDIRGTYRLVNRTSRPIDSLHLTINPELEVRSLALGGATPALIDTLLGYRVYRLADPLGPGESTEIGYDLAVRNPAFVNNGSNTNVVHNGTFFDSFRYFPHIGYNAQFELGDPNERRKRGLPEVERMPKLDDPAGLNRTYISGQADWVEFETVVSTTPDQIALAPGYLEREWVEEGRRYFHYAMDAPILPFWAYLSAEWEVRTDRWNDVEIAVYYHPDHPYNVDRMIDATKKSLDYFTRAFGPYQHRQVRIVEFPRYARFAQSFPNTIPFSESIGFIARLDDDDAVDYVFYVTAHEVAHQWWAHQVIGANVQGATVLSETMAQYSALMVMEREYGPQQMRRFLKYELDSYLRGRGGERIEELPLYLVENQPYIHYNKGSLAMYALRDYVGEDALNEAIAAYVREVRFQDPPYTTSVDLLDHIATAVPDGHDAILDDLFRTITLWDLRAAAGEVEPLEDGRHRVTVTVEARKYRATGEGVEEPVAMDDRIDIGVFGDRGDGSPPEGQVLFLEKRRVVDGTQTFEIVVDRPPRQVGIDPFNKLIDRNPEDNLTRVSGPRISRP